MKTKEKKGLQYKNFHKFRLSSQNSCDFPRILKQRPKKRSSFQKFYEIQCESTKITKNHFLLANSRAVNTNLGVLGLDLHSSGSEPGNFFGAQSSSGGGGGGHKQSFGGARPRNAPRGAGPSLIKAAKASLMQNFTVKVLHNK